MIPGLCPGIFINYTKITLNKTTMLIYQYLQGNFNFHLGHHLSSLILLESADNSAFEQFFYFVVFYTKLHYFSVFFT